MALVPLDSGREAFRANPRAGAPYYGGGYQTGTPPGGNVYYPAAAAGGFYAPGSVPPGYPGYPGNPAFYGNDYYRPRAPWRRRAGTVIRRVVTGGRSSWKRGYRKRSTFPGLTFLAWLILAGVIFVYFKFIKK